jgi:threonine aldolase
MIDLRSDTVTRPTPAMRSAMAEAEVGDDVYGEDPTVHALEASIAARCGKEAALFVTSGSMGNQLAIAAQTVPGDEVIVGEGAHPVFYEVAAGAVLSGVQFAVAGKGGTYDADEMVAAIKQVAYYSPRTSLVCVENTHNRAGGRVFPQAQIERIGVRAKEHGLRFHLDGARIWNAMIATKLPLDVLAAPFDSISVCFSKGLGAPVGSALVADRATIERARRFRKMWGGGMRQAGIVAAGALYALEHHVDRLHEDHEKARAFAELVASGSKRLSVDLAAVETNIVNVDVDGPADPVVVAAKERGLRVGASGPQRIRAVFHMDVSKGDATRAAHALVEAAEEARG